MLSIFKSHQKNSISTTLESLSYLVNNHLLADIRYLSYKKVQRILLDTHHIKIRKKSAKRIAKCLMKYQPHKGKLWAAKLYCLSLKRAVIFSNTYIPKEKI